MNSNVFTFAKEKTLLHAHPRRIIDFPSGPWGRYNRSLNVTKP